jgi:hypothetical protein
VALVFNSRSDAWDARSDTVLFAGEDRDTELPIGCAIVLTALIDHFGARAANVPDLIKTFRDNRARIEQAASQKYDSQGRRGPVILRSSDFVIRWAPKSTAD